jgi:hypothetical protein
MEYEEILDLEIQEEYELRHTEEIAFRAIALSAIIIRGELEQAAVAGSDEGWDILYAKARKVNRWFKETGAHNFLTHRESTLLKKPFGKWDLEKDFDFDTTNNKLGVLLWVLGLIEALPRLDEGFGRGLHWLTGIPTSTRKLFDTIRVRDEEELHKKWVDYDDVAFGDELEALLDLYGDEVILLDQDQLDLMKSRAEARASALAWALTIEPYWD